MGKQGIPGQRALTNNPNLEIEQETFFNSFFADGGKYMKFVTVSGDGSVAGARAAGHGRRSPRNRH
jgi:hypothetical protein